MDVMLSSVCDNILLLSLLKNRRCLYGVCAFV